MIGHKLKNFAFEKRFIKPFLQIRHPT